jgi:thiol-disulfide isomerase/thioredoxin
VKTTVLLLLFLAAASNLAELEGQVTVPLRRAELSTSSVGNRLLCDDKYDCGLGADEQSKVSPNNKVLLLKVSRAGNDFELLIDTNQNGSLADERSVPLRNSGSARIVIRKKVAARRYTYLPFEIAHEKPEAKGVKDEFVVTRRYMAAGTLTYKKCTSQLSLLDLDSDGRFTAADSSLGTNLRIDQNNDGKFWGKGEYAHSAGIVAFCGQNFVVTSLSNKSLVLVPTDLQLAKLKEAVPSFSLALLNGQVVSAASLKGKSYVMDFWASWCVPCVKNLKLLESLREEYNSLSVFSVNVDKPSRRGLAQKIIADNCISEFAAIRGLGSNDPIWKTFAGADWNILSIPLYVLIDKEGVLRYAGNGGEKLIELRSEIEKLLSAREFDSETSLQSGNLSWSRP